MDLIVLGDFLERLRKRKPAAKTNTNESWKDIGADPEDSPTGLDASMSSNRPVLETLETSSQRPLTMPMTTRRIAYRIAGLILAIIAAYLAWNCNEGNKSLVYRIITTVLAFIFGVVYIVLYLFLHSEVCRSGRRSKA